MKKFRKTLIHFWWAFLLQSPWFSAELTYLTAAMLMDKKKIVSFYSELPSLYMHSPKNYCFVNQHGCMLCCVIEKNSNMLRWAIFVVTKSLFRLYINGHPKSDIMYIVFHLCDEKWTNLSTTPRIFKMRRQLPTSILFSGNCNLLTDSHAI